MAFLLSLTDSKHYFLAGLLLYGVLPGLSHMTGAGLLAYYFIGLISGYTRTGFEARGLID